MQSISYTLQNNFTIVLFQQRPDHTGAEMAIWVSLNGLLGQYADHLLRHSTQCACIAVCTR